MYARSQLYISCDGYFLDQPICFEFFSVFFMLLHVKCSSRKTSRNLIDSNCAMLRLFTFNTGKSRGMSSLLLGL